MSELQWPYILKNLRFCVFDTIFAVSFTFLDLYRTLRTQFQSKYRLFALLELDLKVTNHLAEFQNFSDIIYGKICDCVFLTQFSIYFLPFRTSMGPSRTQFQGKYRLSALLELDLKVTNHLLQFQDFSGLIYWKICDFVFLTQFSLYFLPFWTSMGP